MKVLYKKVRDTAKEPVRGSKFAAGYDLSACVDDGSTAIYIPPNTCVKVPTGLAFVPPDGYVGLVFARSGLATKSGLRPANCVGVVDEDYRGEVMVALYNDSDATRVVHDGERVAQIVFTEYLNADMVEVDELSETERGEGGFGSTGK